MSIFSRRSFLSASVVTGMAVASGPVRASNKVVARAGTPMNEGIFNVYLSNDRVIMMVSSAGRTPFPVIFDTGTTGNAIDVKVAKALKLKTVPDHVHTVVDGITGESFDTPGYIMPALRIGTFDIGDRQVSAYPYERPDRVGIFGPNLFKGQLVYIDLGAARVRVINKSGAFTPAGVAIPYLGPTGEGTPAADILLSAKAGEPPLPAIRADLDSGNNNLLNLPVSYIGRLPLMSAPAVVGRTTSVSGSRDVMGARLNGDMRIGSISFHNPDIIFDGQLPNVGLPAIRRLRFLLDPEGEQGWMIGPVAATAAELADYVGQYGTRLITLSGGKLLYQRASGSLEQELVPLGNDLFDIAATGAQLHFERKEGTVTGAMLISSSNQTVFHTKLSADN